MIFTFKIIHVLVANIEKCKKVYELFSWPKGVINQVRFITFAL